MQPDGSAKRLEVQNGDAAQEERSRAVLRLSKSNYSST
jgi:hypothetical protein